MQFNSIRFKASVLYSLILALILCIFSAVVYLSIRNILYKDLDRDLLVKAQEISHIISAYDKIERSREQPLGALLKMLENEGIGTNQKMIIDDLWRSQFESLNLKNDFINILNIKGRRILNSNNLNGSVAALFSKGFPFTLNKRVFKTLTDEKYKLRAINLPIQFHHHSQLVIQVGTSLKSTDFILHKLFLFIGGTMFVLLIISSFIGRIFTENILRPVKEVADLANKITYKDLSVRIKKKNIDIEMETLVNSFNVMIKRLETSFGHINEFSSHAAHELKTPLAILRGEIELALDKERTSAEYKKILENCLSEIDRMVKVVRDLLLLAKLDYKPEVFHFEKMDLISLLKNIYEQSQILAESKNIKVEFNLPETEIMVNADKVHLRRLFHNIIGNAIKYIPESREVVLTVNIEGSQCCIDIADTGNGISEENLEKIFNKFFRVQQDDVNAESSTGLGLSIALSIAKAHKGNITVQSQIGKGTTFTVILPVV